MFVRLKTLHANRRTYQYLHIVENRWEHGKVRQHVVGSLGRLDQLQASGDLRRVIEGLVAQCPAVRLREAAQQDHLVMESDRLWGPVLILERLWQDLGLEALLREPARGRPLGFDVERCAFAHVLQRLLAPGSDRRGAEWIQTVEGRGFEALRLPHFYQTAGWLWRRKEQIEQYLYDRDLFNEGLDLVFFDTTSTYLEGRVWEGWAKLGKSRDHRSDHLQLMLGVAMRRDGVPVSCEIWPGNLHDTQALVLMLKQLQERFRIRKVVLVCDRGMVSAANLKAIRQAGYDYLVGMKMRGLLEVREKVLKCAGRYQEVQHNLWVKEVEVGRHRYVVCRNPERAEKDRQDRAAILEKLRAKLASGGVKKLISNRGYRRFLKVSSGAAAIDEARVQADEKYDGQYVLRTTADLSAGEVAEAYKQLSRIERLGRELKDVMEVRPIFPYQKKENVKGHIFASFLALYLSATLRRRFDTLWQQEHPEAVPPRGPAEPAHLPVR